jgi:A/G-specific adenine glycosylase
MLTGRALLCFRKKMLAWFSEFQRDLPWRRTKDPYGIWISEIMLQQTRVAAVIPYYQRFLTHFPEVQALAKASEEEVLRLWAGLGYYSRARNLQKAARQMVTKYDAKFPATLEESLTLSGIGAYTASAILSIAYGKKLAVLDGNVARVIARLGAMRGDLRTSSRWQKLQECANQLLAPQAPGEWNQAMMEVGAIVCTPRSPQCLLCPVADFCKAHKLGLTDVIPEKRSRRAPIEITLAALVLTDSAGRALVLAPPKSEAKSATNGEDVAGLLSRMWHFPTIQVKADPAKELRAFARKSIFGGGRLSVKLKPMPRVRHTVTYRKIMLVPFRVEMAKLPRVPHSELLPLDDLDSLPISSLTRKVARAALPPARQTREENDTVLPF